MACIMDIRTRSKLGVLGVVLVAAVLSAPGCDRSRDHNGKPEIAFPKSAYELDPSLYGREADRFQLPMHSMSLGDSIREPREAALVAERLLRSMRWNHSWDTAYVTQGERVWLVKIHTAAAVPDSVGTTTASLVLSRPHGSFMSASIGGSGAQ